MYVKIQADAQLECIALAEELGADAAPCMIATLDKGEVSAAKETSEACWYVWGTSDSEKCPIPEDANDDDVGTSDGESGSESDSGSDGDSGESGPPPARPARRQAAMRRRRLRWGLLLGLGLGLACQGRLADLEQEERFVFCAGVNGARVIEEDGDHFRPWPPDEHPRPCGSESASGCGMDSDSPQYEQP